MLAVVVDIQREHFNEIKKGCVTVQGSTSTAHRKHLEDLIAMARVCHDSITFISLTDLMGAAIRISRTDGSNTRREALSKIRQNPPSCCLNVINNDGFLCWYGEVVICEKYSLMNVHRFIHLRY